MDEHANALIELEKKFNLTNEKSRVILLIQKDILLKNQKGEELISLVQNNLKINDNISKQIALEIWGNYFLLFQDFLGKVDDLIVQNGGDLKKNQERARKLLSPHRQLQDFIKPYIYDFGLENAGDAARDELIDIMLDRALGKIDEEALVDRLQALIAKSKVETKATDVADTIENLLVAGDISKKWAEYYANLAENVLSGRPFVDEEEKKETEEEPLVLEKPEAKPRKELSVAEIQEKINKLSSETDLIKKINDAKELLGGLNIYGMKKTEIYDTIKQAEISAEHLGKSQNVLEKRAVEDELRGLVDKIMADVKESAAAPASAEEIQSAMRDLG
ncbi:hypothetical protein EPN15_03655 [Patescibacteria group bacterium]|nr:MAG: hypothetical protein EPN15_03655 [Patescibacteria group bacterium]